LMFDVIGWVFRTPHRATLADDANTTLLQQYPNTVRYLCTDAAMLLRLTRFFA